MISENIQIEVKNTDVSLTKINPLLQEQATNPDLFSII